jgi:cholesterol oxidase
LRHGPATEKTHHALRIPIVEEFVDRMAAKMDGHEGALPFEVIDRTASAHFTGGIPIGTCGRRRR